MAQQRLPDDLAREALKLRAEYGDLGKAAAATGIPYNTLHYRWKTAAKRGFDSAIVMPAPDGHHIRGVSTNYTADGEIISQWVKTTRDQVPIEEIIERLSGAFADIQTRAPAIARPKRTDADLLAVYPLIDWHIGLRAWALETGENYDLKIAREAIMGAQRTCIEATPPAGTAVILGIGDILHFDGYEPVTPRSRHQLDTDGRFPLVLDTAANMVEETIELALARHGKVHVRILPGNHDPVSSVALALMLKRVFRGNRRVTIDDDYAYHWWFRFGKVFLGGSHGDKTKMKDLPLLMAHDRPDDWAASTYRRIYTGHIHHETRIEDGGVVVTSMRSPVARDAYHSFAKYRAGRSVYSETFDADGSKAATVQINL